MEGGLYIYFVVFVSHLFLFLGNKVVVVEPLVYFAFLFFNETVITKTQGLVVAIAKREHINKSK